MILTIWDLILFPFYASIALFVSYQIQKSKQVEFPEYKYYTQGLIIKISGGIILCFVYVFYYGGGDTINYFNSSRAMVKLGHKDFQTFLSIMSGNNSIENYYTFDLETGFPVYWKKEGSFFFSRFAVPFCVLGLNSIIPTIILLAWACYSGVWRLYLLFVRNFPTLTKEFAISMLFIPSVVFWGSGLLKDTVTLSAVGWYSYSFFNFFIKKERKLTHMIAFVVSMYLLIEIKPYIAFALLPGSLIWLANQFSSRIQNNILRKLALPFFTLGGILLGILVLNQLGDYLGFYSVDQIFERAVVVQNDLKKDYYGGNTFDIGSFDASMSSMLSKAHLAITAALFRPFLWEVKNPVMFVTALENTYFLLLTIYLLIKLKIINLLFLIGNNPLLLFSIIFSLFFAFSVGITTPNFGSLARLRIPCIPFYVANLFILRYLYETQINPLSSPQAIYVEQ